MEVLRSAEPKIEDIWLLEDESVFFKMVAMIIRGKLFEYRRSLIFGSEERETNSFNLRSEDRFEDRHQFRNETTSLLFSAKKTTLSRYTCFSQA